MLSVCVPPQLLTLEVWSQWSTAQATGRAWSSRWDKGAMAVCSWGTCTPSCQPLGLYTEVTVCSNTVVLGIVTAFLKE